MEPLRFARPSDAVDYLLAPCPMTKFNDEVYERTPLIIRRDEPERYRGLLSIDVIDHLVANVEMRSDMLQIVRANPKVAPREYTLSNGVVDPIRLADLYADGATIVLNQLQRLHAPLDRLTRALEAAFSMQFQTNVYLTPAIGKGFPVHYDNHDVVVLQVEGSKAWRLYEAPIHLVYRGERFEPGAYDPGETTDSFTLHAGDALYIPRGQMHEAAGNEHGPSLHITVGILAKTWTDLILEAVADVALVNPEFRRSLPLGFTQQGADLDAMRDTFEELMAWLADHATMDPALAVMRDDFVRRRRPHIDGAVLTPRPVVQATTQLVARPHLVWRLAQDDKGLELLANGRTLRFPVEDREAIKLALSGETFVAGDLPNIRPLELARYLVNSVLVVPVD
ncbi:MAG: cupin domain-containing protein [Pseudomonadota bacterium]